MRNSALSSGALPLKPRDLSLLRQNRSATSGRLPPPRPFRHLNRRSGRISALPYPPLRCFQNGPYRPSPAMIFHWTATTLLTCCLTPGVQFKIDLKKPSEYPVPEELQSRLDDNAVLRSAFATLTPGRRKSYIFHVSSAKQAKTRAARAEKCVPMILSGRGFDEVPN
jgi:hypothetical protein